MAEAHLPPDELVSRYLDGDLPDDERALVDGDPTLRAALEQALSVRDALRSVPPLDPVRAAALLAAALSAYDEVVDAAPATPAHATDAVPMRAVRWRRPLAWAGGLAAAGLLVVGGIAVLGGNDDGPQIADDQRTTLAAETMDASAAAVAEAFDLEPSATEAPLAGAEDASSALAGSDARLDEPFPLPPAGTPVVLDDLDMFRWFARWATPVPVSDVEPDTVPCLDAGPDALLAALASFDGTPVTILYDDDTGEAVAYATTTCEVVARVTR